MDFLISLLLLEEALPLAMLLALFLVATSLSQLKQQRSATLLWR
jgi:hypothetical protein